MSQDSFGSTWNVTITCSADDNPSEMKFTQTTDYSTQWGLGSAVSVNSTIGSLTQNGGNLNCGGVSNTKRYTFRMNTGHSSYVVMETTADPVTISGVSDNSSSRYLQSVTVSITLSGAKSAEETVWVCYTINNWSTRTLVQASGSSTAYTATIPAQSVGTTVKYYVITSSMPQSTIESNYDLCTLKGNNNSGSNYSYTFPAKVSYYWRNEAVDNKWDYNSTPPWWDGATTYTVPANNGIIHVDNNNRAGTWDQNKSGLIVHQLSYDVSATTARTLTGNRLTFTDFYGDDPIITNGSTAAHAINVGISGDATDPLYVNATLGDLSFGAGLANNGQNVVFDAASGKTITFSGIVSNAGGVVKYGAGTLTLSGANTYTGKTAVNAGTLSISSKGNLGPNPGSLTADQLTLNGGTLKATANVSLDNQTSYGITIGAAAGTFEVDFDKKFSIQYVIAGASDATLNKTGSGLLELSIGNTYAGETRIREGMLRVSNDAALGTTASGTFVSDGATLDIYGKQPLEPVTIAGAGYNSTGALVNLSYGGATDLKGTLTLANNASVGGLSSSSTLLSGVISDGGNNYTLTKVGTNIITLSGVNTFTGTLFIQEGTIRSGNAAAFGTTAAGVTVNGSATLDLYGGKKTISGEAVQIGGAGVNSAGTLVNNHASEYVALNGTVTMVANSSIGGRSEMTLQGVIGQSGGTYGLTKVGAGTLILCGNNTFAGGVTVNAGTLRVGGSGALNSSTPNAVTMAGGTLQVCSNSVTVADLSGNGTVENGHASARILTINKTSGSSTVSAAVQNGAVGGTLAVVKQGSGTLLLAGANTYSGATTVEAGTLGGAGCSSSATTVKSGATVAPGTSIGTFNTGSASFETGSAYECEVDGDSSYDTIAVTGNLTLPTGSDTTTIELKGSGLATHKTYTVMTYTGTLGGGNAANIDAFAAVAGCNPVTVTVGGNVVTLQTAPEPGLLGLAGLLFLGLRAGAKLKV